MTKTEAKKEFVKNRDQYITVDFTNNFYYRIYKQNFIFLDDKLSCVVLSPKGYALGMGYDSAKNYLIHTRSFFEDLNYETFIDDEFWNAPINYIRSGSKWGLVLYNPEKTKIIQMFPQELKDHVYYVYLRVWNYDVWMNLYLDAQSVNSEKLKDSGF
ncbi:hypothetical protein ACFFU1_16790 [Algibacter miyuki]|uniref:Uncharacterized protein n=1 Tax=Algibacter miyuki TaxID=1306933 RepID=A0ABV5H3W7_9FLAO|nr:hypothetical protein [Algibacter miyuki]MDN3665637.1 hypothetical protein [Algibacter miyuki]